MRTRMLSRAKARDESRASMPEIGAARKPYGPSGEPIALERASRLIMRRSMVPSWTGIVQHLSFCAMLSLAACATKPPAPLPTPEPVVRTVTVDRIIQVPCISKLPDLPMYSDTDMALSQISDDFDGAWLGIALLKGGRAQRNAYIDQLRAVLQSCVKPPS